ncbi:MAG TPA: MBL fold metallo-hydrolase [Candidatus Avilachnospira avistercoris]|nr:MBL fold metallo-hydrolase [Candidatus Avilachnospira avistercoris]
MKLTFIGADHEVTGSRHLLETKDTKILVDCGMEQGSNPYENAPMPVDFPEIDYIILTHAHIDHAGMIPYAYAHGFSGTVLATDASMDLDSIMLLDSANIQEQDAEWENRKAKRAGKPLVEPLYTVEDAKKALESFRAIPYGKIEELSDTVKLRFIDAGHLLGSASAEIWIDEDGVSKKLVFSGDIGNHDKPLIRDPQYIDEADYVIMESTYGDRHHAKGVDHIRELSDIIQRTLDRGGNVVIPAFAVGRTQEMLYFIRRIKADGLVKGHDGFPVYVDSPLAIEATKIFRENLTECYDEETKKLVLSGINPIGFPNLRLSVTADDSKAINFDQEPKVIISASGMCDAGRIRHHLKHNLWRPACSVVFAGYQAEGTLGRQLQDGKKDVKIFGEAIHVEASIETMGDMSSHADQEGLLSWVGAYKKAPSRVFLVHGDDGAMEELSGLIKERYGFKVECPYSGTVFDLAADCFIHEAEPVFRKKQTAVNTRNEKIRSELSAAMEELEKLCGRYEAFSNKDIRKLTADIRDIINKHKTDD